MGLPNFKNWFDGTACASSFQDGRFAGRSYAEKLIMATIWRSLKFGMQAVAMQRVAEGPREEILRLQQRRLKRLVGHAKSYSPYYREKFAGLKLERLNLNDIPTSNKSELMAHFRESLTVEDVRRGDVERFLLDDHNLGKYFLDKYIVSHTSGSQGRPLLLIYPRDNIELLFALQASRGNRRHLGVLETVRRWFRPARLATVVLKPGFYPSSTALEYMPEGVRPYLQVQRMSVGDADLVARLNEFRPTHLTGYASTLHELARQIEQGNLTLKPELEQVVNISECLLPQARERYVRLFGAPVLDDYAMGECLFLSNGCPTSGGMHVNDDWAILEVVDEENRAVAAGTPGAKVLVTNLANLVQPIVRYEIGDLVTMAKEPCGCDSQLSLVARVEGRDSELLRVRGSSGVREISSGVVQVAVEGLLDVREYQLVQLKNDRVRILIEPLPNSSFDLEWATKIVGDRLRANGVDPDGSIELEVVDELAGCDDRKFKRVVQVDDIGEDIASGASGRRRGDLWRVGSRS
jgi:phenylacetate-coenzyme A ligase PaaK-like adenylate-forming protein